MQNRKRFEGEHLRRIWVASILASSATSALCPTTAQGADDCRAILDHGIYNTYQQLMGHNLNSEFKTGLCQAASSNARNNQGGKFALGIPIGGISLQLNAGSSDSRVQEIANKACGSSSSELTDDQAEQLLVMTVDQRIVEAWSKCRSGGFYVDGELVGTTLALQFGFKQEGAVAQTQLTRDPEVTNLRCNALPTKGDTISGAGYFTQCQRLSDDPIVVTANSTINAAAFFAPQKPAVIAKPACKPKAIPVAFAFQGGALKDPPDGQYWCQFKWGQQNNELGWCPTFTETGECICDVTGDSPFAQRGRYSGRVLSSLDDCR
jgi:hypothetical protein